MTIENFLEKVACIASLAPTYALGGTGADGTCDCIGLIIGAVDRNGVSWDGMHGSNWWARYFTADLRQIPDASVLRAGDLVYKARSAGESGYDLPSRYAKHPDQLDYYHVGVVTSTDPLEITHCTSGGGANGIVVDTRLGNWGYYGHLTLIDDAMGDAMSDVKTATVTADNGKPVNLRKAPTVSGALVDRIAVGTVVVVESVSNGWAKIVAAGRRGYMSTDYLRMDGEPDAQSDAIVQRLDELTRTVAALAERVAALEGGSTS